MGVVIGVMTPIAGAPMMIAMNPRGCKFMDFAKIGFPLQVLVFIVSMTLVPVFWSL